VQVECHHKSQEISAGEAAIVCLPADPKWSFAAFKPLGYSFREPNPRPEIVTHVSQEQFQRITFSNDGSLMATAAGHVITLWDSRSRRQLRTILDHSEAVSALEFGPDPGTLVGAARDFTVRVWSTRTGAEKCRLTALAKSDAPSITLSPDGERIAVGESGPGLTRIIRTADCIEESSVDSGPVGQGWAKGRTLLIPGKKERNLLLSVDLERNSETRVQAAAEFRSIATLSDGRAAILLSDGSLPPQSRQQCGSARPVAAQWSSWSG
jgi:WD40 repeat protein